jgi:hypothetical protein
MMATVASAAWGGHLAAVFPADVETLTPMRAAPVIAAAIPRARVPAFIAHCAFLC